MIAFCSKTTLNAIEVKTFQELIFFLTISVMVCKYREELIKDCCTLEDVGGTVNLNMCYILAVLDLIVYQDPLLKILNVRWWPHRFTHETCALCATLQIILKCYSYQWHGNFLDYKFFKFFRFFASLGRKAKWATPISCCSMSRFLFPLSSMTLVFRHFSKILPEAFLKSRALVFDHFKSTEKL